MGNAVNESRTEDAAQDRDLDSLVTWVARTPLIVATVFCLLGIAYVLAFAANGWSAAPDAWGQLGDYIGGLLNPLVAVFALVALAASVRLQRRELSATRAELRAAKDAAQEQANTAEQQRREQRFFDVLRLYQETLASVAFERSTENGPQSFAGKSAFQYMTTMSLKTSVAGGRNDLPIVLGQAHSITDADTPSITAALDKWASLLDHYFRVIFLLLREAEPTLGEEHFRYVKYLRAQLSRDELQLLALNMLFDAEGCKMIPWAKKYGLLKHLPSGRLRSYAEAVLAPEVFGRGWIAANKRMN